MDSTFRAGGLATGMDTNTMVDQLVKLESRQLDLLRTRQAAFKAQISALGELASRLAGLETAAKDLGTAGVLGVKAVSTQDSFTAAPGAGATAGRYSISVEGLARASKWRSAAFAGSTAPVAGGTLQLSVMGTSYDPITIADGASLSDVALAIQRSGAPVSAVVLSDGTSSYLSVTARDTGFPLSGTPAAALSLAFTPAAGATGTLPGFGEVQPAANATLWVDGLKLTRQSNTVTDAVPGTTLTLKKGGAPAEDLVLATDVDATRARLQKFADAYNDVMKLVQKHLAVLPGSDRTRTLAGDSSVRGLQSSLQRLVTSIVPGQADVRTLADLGFKTARDGSLSIDGATLNYALSRAPAAVDALFSTASTGLSALTSGMVQAQTRTGDGILTLRQSGLDSTVSTLDRQAASMELRIEAFRQNLIRQFTAMERTVSSMKSIGAFLTSQDAKANQ